MNPIHFALRRPKTVIVLLITVVMTGLSVIRPGSVDTWLRDRGVELPLKRMAVDIFPALNLPVIYVCQPYGGMDPAQMEGLLTNYYEYHFLYINGIHHVESRNVQGTALMKLQFHPGTNMAQAMAETINYVNRSRAMMPPGTVPPFVMRFDTGSVPVGYLVLSSGTKTIAEIQDQALFKVRPMFSSLPGVSAPPPFGGSARSIVIRANPDRLRAYGLSPDDVISALTSGNTISPSGNIHLGDRYPAVPTNAMVRDVRELGQIPLRTGEQTVYMRDIGTIEDAADLTTGYALVNGRRAVYILATKRADASTMNVISEIRNALPKMQKELPGDIQVAFEFDQSPYVTRAIGSLATEGILGAFLTGLMVLLFLRDWRSALVVVLNIPLAILSAIVGLWLTGQTINLMTLGGLALAVGILVDEATVEMENIHTQMGRTRSIGHAVLAGNQQTAVPRLLAMLCILAVFVPTFFMEGAPRELFAPLSLAVGFAMISSYLLSSTFVPILCVWLLKNHEQGVAVAERAETAFVTAFRHVVRGVIAARWISVPAYVVLCGWMLWLSSRQVGVEIFPAIDAGEFRLRLRADDGTHIDRTEAIAKQVLETVAEVVGPDRIRLTLGYVGTVPASFPINAVYQFSRGPEEAILRIALKPDSGVSTEAMKVQLRDTLARKFPDVRFSFEPADIVSEVMSFGSATPIEVVVRGGSIAENRDFLKRVQQSLSDISSLRDIQVVQALDYPTVDVRIDREKAGLSGVNMNQVSRSVLAATSSSRFVVPNYWPDPKTGVGYQVQVEIPQPAMASLDDLGTVPILNLENGSPLLLRDVAQITPGTMPGEFDRYNMKRELSLTANIVGADLGSVATQVIAAVDQVRKDDDAAKDEIDKAAAAAAIPGQPAPAKAGRITCELRGQIPPLRQMMSGLGVGLLLALVAIFLMLTANYQSFRLSLVTVAAAPAVVAGAALILWATRSTLNIQSFIGVIMGLGVAMANAILVVTFAEERRRNGENSMKAAENAVVARLRPILMTSCAMLAGMLPLALGLGESGQQTAPLGRAVMGSLLAATMATLFFLPAVFALIQSRSSTASPSLHPLDSEGRTAGLVMMCLLMFTLAGCRPASESAASVEQSAAILPKVTTATPARRTITQKTIQPGQIQAFSTTPIHSRAAGYVDQVKADIGDRVKGPVRNSQGTVTEPGQLLAVLSAPEVIEECHQKEAMVEQVRAEVLQSEAAVKVAMSLQVSAAAGVEECLAGQQRARAQFDRWKSEYDRIQVLADSKTVTPKLAEETELQFRSAQAGLSETDARLKSSRAAVNEAAVAVEKAQADLEAMKSHLKVAEADRDRVAALRDYLQIRAPFDGIITERRIDAGHLVQPARSSADEPLFVLIQADTVRLFVDVPEADAALVETGRPAKITVSAMGNAAFDGVVARTSWALQSGTRSLRCEIDVPNGEGRLRPGMYAQVELTVAERSDVLTVPKTSIVVRDGQSYCVEVTADGSILRRAVQTGIRSATDVEIISGLNGNEDLVSANAAAFTDGQKVDRAAP